MGEESKGSTAMLWAIPDPASHEKNKRLLPLLPKFCAVQGVRQRDDCALLSIFAVRTSKRSGSTIQREKSCP